MIRVQSSSIFAVIAAARKRVIEGFDNRQLIRDLASVYREGMGRRAEGIEQGA